MGTVISFPGARRSDESRASEEHHGPATIIILPVIRIERYVDEPKVKAPASPRSAGRKRRRRSSRS
ncbi:MAG: hypothetical protein U1E81_18910 [Xanthobacteraceae bacterium]